MKIKVIILLITVLASMPAFAAPAEREAKNILILTGTWVTTVAPPPEAEAPPFSLIFSFMSDHNLIATGTGGQFPALGNPCQGTWSRTGEGEFTLTYLCLDFDSSFQFTGTDKLTARVTVHDDGNHLDGRIRLTNFDPQGHEVFSACCATVNGARVEVELLNEAPEVWRPGRQRQ